jgi:hypothetical protein
VEARAIRASADAQLACGNMGTFRPTEVVYSDLYYDDRRADVDREILVSDVHFASFDTLMVCYKHFDQYVIHTFQLFPFRHLQCSRSVTPTHPIGGSPHTCTAWKFLTVVRPEDVDGMGLEYFGDRIWDMFWTEEDRAKAALQGRAE